MVKKRYRCCAAVSGSKYLGEVEADDAEEAKDLAEQLGSCYISLCHQCSSECEDPEVTEVFVEEIIDEAAEAARRMK